MKLRKINEVMSNYQGSFVLHPSIMGNYSEIDFAEKYWELDFLKSLEWKDDVFEKDLSYTEKNRAENLIRSGLVGLSGRKYFITDEGSKWYNIWMDARQNIVKTVTLGSQDMAGLKGMI